MSRLCARRSKPGGLPPFGDGVDGKAAGVVIAPVASARCTLSPPSASARLRQREGREGREDREEGESLEDSLERSAEVDRDARREGPDEGSDVRKGNDNPGTAAHLFRGEEVDREQEKERELAQGRIEAEAARGQVRRIVPDEKEVARIPSGKEESEDPKLPSAHEASESGFG